MSTSVFGKVRISFRDLGPLEFCGFVVRKILSIIVRKLNLTKIDLAEQYEFVAHEPFGSAPPSASERCSLNWVIPDFNIGSGGHINIFRLIDFCERAGFICRVIIVGPTARTSSTRAKKMIREHFSLINAEVFIGKQAMPPADITIATSWSTAYLVDSFSGSRQKAYFVQDYEPYFYARGAEYHLAQHTYEMGLFGITAGDWLAKKLAAEHGMESVSMGFSYDRELYSQKPRSDDKVQRVFFYARPVTPRRCFELGLLALQRVAKARPDVRFILVGWETDQYEIGFEHLNPGVVPVANLAAIYSDCDVALVISLTNLSLLPLELMACGCPVVSNRGSNTEWLLNESNALLVDPMPEAMADGLLKVLADQDLRRKLSNQGKLFAQATSWKQEADKVITALNGLGARPSDIVTP
jgi:glycosyltransferase involved in cell wall biosynthesis